MNNSITKKVSIGIPTYNRFDSLVRSVDSILVQTYTNIEIIISDNASPQSIQSKLKDYYGNDDRIKIFYQKENMGAFNNFKFVLEQSSGDYFMWAADDDYRLPWYIEHCVFLLEKYPIAAATTETEYTIRGQGQPNLRELNQFYSYKEESTFKRLLKTIIYNNGNLVYALFKKEYLLEMGRCVWLDAALTTGTENELPLIIHTAFRGGFLVSEVLGFEKEVSPEAYCQICWEVWGGKIPGTSKINSLNSLYLTFKYHLLAFFGVIYAFKRVDINMLKKNILLLISLLIIVRHFIYMLIGWRPKINQSTPKNVD